MPYRYTCATYTAYTGSTRRTMHHQANAPFLTTFREHFTRHFPAWAARFHMVNEATFEVAIPAPHIHETAPLFIHVDQAGEIMVAWGASHAHVDEQWVLDEHASIVQALECIHEIVTEQVVRIYLTSGSALVERATAPAEAWFRHATRMTSWHGTYDQQLGS